MLRLHEIQQAFAEGIIDGKYNVVAAPIVPRGSALRNVALYRRLIRTNYTQVLAVTYPVLRRLVGSRYFDLLARGYLKAHPSTSGDLFFYGQYLPTFLYGLQVAPLLVELARLEWACHEVHQAADSTPVSQEQIQAIASIDPAHLTIHFHAAARLLWFPLPIHRIWQALQPDGPIGGDVGLPLPEEETGIVVTRGDGKVQVTSLAMPDYLVLEALLRGEDLASVEQIAIASDPEFDFQRWWASVLNLSLISDFSVKETP